MSDWKLAACRTGSHVFVAGGGCTEFGEYLADFGWLTGGFSSSCLVQGVDPLQVPGQGDQVPFALHLGEASEQELAEAEH